MPIAPHETTAISALREKLGDVVRANAQLEVEVDTARKHIFIQSQDILTWIQDDHQKVKNAKHARGQVDAENLRLIERIRADLSEERAITESKRARYEEAVHNRKAAEEDLAKDESVLEMQKKVTQDRQSYLATCEKETAELRRVLAEKQLTLAQKRKRASELMHNLEQAREAVAAEQVAEKDSLRELHARQQVIEDLKQQVQALTRGDATCRASSSSASSLSTPAARQVGVHGSSTASNRAIGGRKWK